MKSRLFALIILLIFLLSTSAAAIYPMPRFADDYVENLTDYTNYGEPTAIVSDDGLQIDLWFVKDGNQIYYTYSTDGITWAAETVTDIPSGYKRPHVLKDGSTYYLYASGSSDTTIHLFTSTDKTTFTDQGQVIGPGTAGQWDDGLVANSFVFKEGSTVYILYEANDGAVPWKIGLATASAYGGPFTKYGSNPVIIGTGNGVGNPELPRSGSSVIKHEGKYYCYFHGQTASNSGVLGRAYSSDLQTWTVEGDADGPRFEHLPIWDGSTGFSYGDHALVWYDGKSYLFWSPSDQVSKSHIDYGWDDRPLPLLLALEPDDTAGEGPVLTATTVSDTEIDLDWRYSRIQLENGDYLLQETGDYILMETGGTVTGWKIYRSADNKNFTQVDGTIAAGTLTYSDTGLSASTTYYYYVVAVTSQGDTATSNIDSTATDAAAVTARFSNSAVMLSAGVAMV